MNAISIYRRENTAHTPEYTETRPDESAGRIVSIETDHISPNPSQPRKNYEGEAMTRLADSIRRYGILQPLTVKRDIGVQASDDPNLLSSDAKPQGFFAHEYPQGIQLYELVAGQRRLNAAKLIGLKRVPCIVLDGRNTAGDMPMKCAEMAIIENIQREDLNIFEQAGAIASLIDVYSLTQEQAASRLSVSQSYVANKLRILRLTEPERKLILEHGLTERHARAVLKVKLPEERMKVLSIIAAEELNVAQAEEYIDRCVGGAQQSDEQSHGKRRFIFRDVRMFFNTIDRAVETMRGAGFAVSAVQRETEDGTEVKIVVGRV